MGYYAHGSQSAGKVFIKAENVPQAYKAAITTIHDDTMRQDAKTLRDIMSWNGWQSDEDDDGNIVYVWFEDEKWFFDSEKLLSVISRWVQPGVIIEMTGEDDAHWAYAFKNGEVQEFSGHIEYPGMNEFLKGDVNNG